MNLIFCFVLFFVLSPGLADLESRQRNEQKVLNARTHARTQ